MPATMQVSRQIFTEKLNQYIFLIQWTHCCSLFLENIRQHQPVEPLEYSVLNSLTFSFRVTNSGSKYHSATACSNSEKT